MLQAIQHNMLNWRDFRGRTTRRHFWYFVLFLLVLRLIATIIEGVMDSSQDGLQISFGLYFGFNQGSSWWDNIFTFIFGFPLMAALARRYHDAGFRASSLALLVFVLLALNTAIGKAFGVVYPPTAITVLIALSIFAAVLMPLLRPSDPNTNRYGPNPNEVPS